MVVRIVMWYVCVRMSPVWMFSCVVRKVLRVLRGFRRESGMEVVLSGIFNTGKKYLTYRML